MEPLRYLTTAQAAVYTGRPVSTIRRWATEGRITRHGSGKNVRYDLRELPHMTRDEWTDEVTLGDPPPLPEGRKAA